MQSINSYVGKTVLITGFRGYIGSSIANMLANVDCCLILADRTGFGWLPKSSKAKILSIKADFTTYIGWEKALINVDYVFHFAAIENDVTTFDWEKDLEANFLSVARLLAVCKKLLAPPRIVFASSTNIFGNVSDFNKSLVLEDPLSLWSVHKLMSEKYLRVYAINDGVESVSLRIPNIYGPSANRHVNMRVVLNKVIRNAIKNKKITLFANRHLQRDFVYISDVSRAFIMAGNLTQANMKDGSSYYVGSGHAFTFKEIWSRIAREVELFTGDAVTIENNDSIPLHPIELRPSIVGGSSFSSYTDWSPKFTLSDGIKDSVIYFGRESE